MRGHQTGLRPASVEATAFFDDLGRYRYGMKMKRQEKDRKKQQQPDDAAASRGAGFHAGMDHNQLSTRVRIGCQSQKPSPRKGFAVDGGWSIASDPAAGPCRPGQRGEAARGASPLR